MFLHKDTNINLHWFYHHPEKHMEAQGEKSAKIITEDALMNELEGKKDVFKISEHNSCVQFNDLATTHLCSPIYPLQLKDLADKFSLFLFFSILFSLFGIHVARGDNWNAHLHIQDPKWRKTVRILDCNPSVYIVWLLCVSLCMITKGLIVLQEKRVL